MDEKKVGIDIDLNRVQSLVKKFTEAADGYNQGEIALAFSAFIAEQATAHYVLSLLGACKEAEATA